MPDNPQTREDVLPHLAGYIEQLGTPNTIEEAIAERNAWVESAAMFSKNGDYYRGLLDEIAAHIGPEAWKADNGDVVDDEPVRARLPDLVHSALSTVNVDALEQFASALEHDFSDNVNFALWQRMCCSGQDCGCMGSTVGQYLAWQLRDTLTKSTPVNVDALREALRECQDKLNVLVICGRHDAAEKEAAQRAIAMGDAALSTKAPLSMEGLEG
jgi:hypothetical protein